MKKKIIFAVATSLFVVSSMLNINVTALKNSDDISLDAIMVMAQADSESPIGMYCYEGIQYTGGYDAVVKCSNCQLYFGYKGIEGTGSSCS